MKIAVIGRQGQLGRELCEQLDARAIGLTHADLDITDRQAVQRVLASLMPDAVVNAAAYTAVDRAEQDADACFGINATAVQHLADACGELDCALVQISSDYVFGDLYEHPRPHVESDPVSPQGVYARSKLAGERAAATAARHFVIRTCGLYGPRTNERQSNFVDTMLRIGRQRPRLNVVDDQWCTPSYVAHVARAIDFLLGTNAYGVYHVVNRGQTSWHAFACEIFRQAGLRVEVEAISTVEYGAPAPRPSYSVLDTSKFESLGGPPLPAWQEALAEYLARLAAT